MSEWLIANAGAIIVALIAAIAAIISVIYVIYQKSFELLTKQRLDTFNSLKEHFAKLRLLSSELSLNAAKQSNNSDAQLLEIESVISQLKSLLPITRSCEFELREAVDMLYDEIKLYLYPQKDRDCKLVTQTQIVFTFADIYLWTEWNYIQMLYKGRRRIKRKRRFEKEFFKNYERAKTLAHDFAFFEKYAKEQLINHS